MTLGARRAGVLFLGCPLVSVRQEAEVGGWLGEDRSAACTEFEGTEHLRYAGERGCRQWFPRRLVTEHAFGPLLVAQDDRLQHRNLNTE